MGAGTIAMSAPRMTAGAVAGRIMTHLSLVAQRTDIFPGSARRAQADELSAEFFAGVSSRYARERPPSSNDNAPKKVLREVGLFLAATSIFVAAICALVPGS
jgi:hypothetical protein